MTKIKASNLPPPNSVAPACTKYHKPLSKKKKKPIAIDMDAIGTPTYNILLDLMRCQVKHPNIDSASDGSDGSSIGGGGDSSVSAAKKCVKVEKMYSACHAAVMGVGNYKGKKHCGEEMERLFVCVNPGSSLPHEI